MFLNDFEKCLNIMLAGNKTLANKINSFMQEIPLEFKNDIFYLSKKADDIEETRIFKTDNCNWESKYDGDLEIVKKDINNKGFATSITFYNPKHLLKDISQIKDRNDLGSIGSFADVIVIDDIKNKEKKFKDKNQDIKDVVNHVENDESIQLVDKFESGLVAYEELYIEEEAAFEYELKKSLIGYYVEISSDEESVKYFGLNNSDLKYRVKLNDYWLKNELDAIKVSRKEEKVNYKETKKRVKIVGEDFKKEMKEELELVDKLLKYDENKFANEKHYIKSLGDITNVSLQFIKEDIASAKKYKFTKEAWWLSSSKEIKAYMYLLTNFDVMVKEDTEEIIDEYADSNIKDNFEAYRTSARLNLEKKMKERLNFYENDKETQAVSK